MRENEKIIDSLKFTVNEIKKICYNRNFTQAIEKCDTLLFDIEILNDDFATEKFSEIKYDIINLIDDLRFIIQTEKRFILFPLPDIKKEAYEIGKKYMNNFMEWVLPDYTPEKLMEILEEESYKLNEVKENLLKTDSGCE